MGSIHDPSSASHDVDALLSIDAASEEIDVLRLAAHHEQERKPVEIAVLEVLELVAEHHAGRTAIPVDERKSAVRFGLERVPDERDDRRDAATRSEGEVVFLVDGVERDVEAALGRRDRDCRTRNERIVGPRGETAVGDALDRDAQLVLRGGGADRVGAAYHLALDLGFDRKELPLREPVTLAQVFRNVERHHERIARCRAHGFDAQRCKGARSLRGRFGVSAL